jgi:spore maturation protein CgeB
MLDYMNYVSLRANGIKNAHWLPGAYDPTVFKDLGIERGRSATFLGTYDQVVHINDGKVRLNYIQDIDAKIPDSMVARGYYAHEANKLWNNTLVGIDVPIVEFTSFRLFQIMASGAMCLTRKPRIEAGWDELFLGEDIVDTYDTSDELCHAVAPYWINQKEKREERVKKSKEFVSKYHSFKNRAWQILNITGLDKRPEPWSKLANLPS